MTRILHTKIETGSPLLASDITNLTFFPVGAILMMDGSWTNGRGGWYTCDGQNGTPDLRNLFIRGGASSGKKGGDDKPSVSLTSDNLPQHKHSFSGITGTIGNNTAGHTHSVTAAGSISGLGTHNHTITNNEGTHGHTIVANQGTHDHTISDPKHSHSISQSGRHGSQNAASNPSAAWDYGDVYWTATAKATSTSESTGVTVVGSQGSHTHTITSNEGGHSHNITSGGGDHEHGFTGSAVTSGGESGTHTHSLTLDGGDTDNTGQSAPFTVDTVPAYYSVIYIKKMKEYV
ncbi:MAG: hypothetical protein LBK68_04885 [Candidatus Margulisbacteria bacterium]|jgi:hypothetical protein|nr:hypothetical protein [Candidatus Margulisiibacteriota bacterium]